MSARLETAKFSVEVAVALAAIAALLLALGTVNTSGDDFREPWFGIGIVIACFAVITVLIAVVIWFKHRREPVEPKASTNRMVIPEGSTVEIRGATITLAKDMILEVDGEIEVTTSPTQPEPEQKPGQLPPSPGPQPGSLRGAPSPGPHESPR